MIFSSRLQKMRESRHLKQSDLSICTGLQIAAISHFETGRRSPSLENLVRLADGLNITTDYLLGRTDENEMNTSSSDMIENLKSVLDKLKTRLSQIVESNPTPVNLAEKRILASRIECVHWQIETIQRPTVFKEQLERVALSEQLKQKYQDFY